MPFPTLATERLILRQLVSNDDQLIFTLRSDKQINKYLDRQIAKTIDDARKFIANVNENISQNKALYWAVTLSDTNTLVGTICLFSFSDDDNRCEIGYELLPDFHVKE